MIRKQKEIDNKLAISVNVTELLAKIKNKIICSYIGIYLLKMEGVNFNNIPFDHILNIFSEENKTLYKCLEFNSQT